MSRIFHHPEFCDQYQVHAHDDGSFFIDDVTHPSAYLKVQSWDDLNRLSDLLILALSITMSLPDLDDDDSEDIPF